MLSAEAEDTHHGICRFCLLIYNLLFYIQCVVFRKHL